MTALQREPSPIVVRLCEIFRTLPLVVSDQGILREQAEALALAAQLSKLNDRPMSRRAGTHQVMDELEALLKAGDDFAVALARMHINTYGTIVRELGDQIRFYNFIQEFDRIGAAIDASLSKLEHPEGARSRPGRPPAIMASEVTSYAAQIYKFLTGQEPTSRWREIAGAGTGKERGPYGPFLEFLARIFEALEIMASANSQARLFARGRADKEVSEQKHGSDKADSSDP
jgi:hypothetical protein